MVVAAAAEKLADVLVGTGLTVPCDDMVTMGMDAWCRKNCKWAAPQKECWIQWSNSGPGSEEKESRKDDHGEKRT